MIRTHNVVRTATLRQDAIGRPSGRSMFILPESGTIRASGTARLSVGKRVYTWQQDAQQKLHTRALEDSCAGEQSSPVSGSGTYIVMIDGRPVDWVTGEPQRTADMADDEPLRPLSAAQRAMYDALRADERKRKGSGSGAGARVRGCGDVADAVPSAAAAAESERRAERKSADEHFRKVLNSYGRAYAERKGVPFTPIPDDRPMTPQLRARAKDLMALSQQQRAMSAR